MSESLLPSRRPSKRLRPSRGLRSSTRFRSGNYVCVIWRRWSVWPCQRLPTNRLRMNFLFRKVARVIQSIFYKINRTNPALVGVLIFFLIGQGSLSGFVLCLGADGHVAVEAAHEKRCGSPSNVTPREPTPNLSMFEAPKTFDHCGPCLDFPVLVDGSTQQYIAPTQNTRSQIKTPIISALSSFRSVLVSTTPEDLQPLTPSLINPTLTLLRTVTLLI